MTNEEALAAWDAGELVHSCSMGGLGEGYEQVIQNMCFEMLRAMLADPVDDWLEMETNKQKWRAYCDKIERAPAISALFEELKPTGAQVGGAMNMAGVFARNGYEKAIEMIPAGRHIQVKKQEPQQLRPQEAFDAGYQAAKGNKIGDGLEEAIDKMVENTCNHRRST